MDQDLLGSIPTSKALVVLDAILAALTSQSAFKRRSSFAILVLTLYLPYFVLFARPSSRSHITTLSKFDLEDAAAAAYEPLPPTADQNRVYLRLLDIIESRESAFTPAIFQERALASDSTRVVGVTAVLLHWKRRKGLQLVIQHISRYPFIREIIIWNNRPGVHLSAKDFNLLSPPGSALGPPRLRIVNSPSNVHDAGKHLACSMASYKHCYFNDDDWLNIYMDSLYVKYLECCAGGGGAGRGGSGGRIASNTMPIIHLEHRRWRFENPDIDLHTGFTWLGTGSFAPRHLSARFLNQQSAAPELLKREQTLVSDMFFALWANSYPEQMPNDLVPIDVEGGEVGWSRGADVDQWSVVYGNILDAIRKLYDILLLESASLCPDPFPVAEPPAESHTRAPCANDGCLFTTSLSPFPPPSALVFPTEQAPRPKQWGFGRLLKKPPSILPEADGKFDPWKVTHMKEYEQQWSAIPGSWPTDEWWNLRGSWHLAVDGKGSLTCWESFRPPDQHDHFGLTLVAPRIVREIKLVGSLDLENVVAWENTRAGAEAWELLTVREDGSAGWETRRLQTLPGVRLLGPAQIEVTLSLERLVDFYGKDIPIRKLKFVSRGKKRVRLTLCSFELDGWKI
ncbi:hypothetical protein T439DRAFT_187316 [Meredithblackwellia eburnea MCA 4105]